MWSGACRSAPKAEGIMDPIAIGIIGLCIVLVLHVPLWMEWML